MKTFFTSDLHFGHNNVVNNPRYFSVVVFAHGHL